MLLHFLIPEPAALVPLSLPRQDYEFPPINSFLSPSERATSPRRYLQHHLQFPKRLVKKYLYHPYLDPSLSSHSSPFQPNSPSLPFHSFIALPLSSHHPIPPHFPFPFLFFSRKSTCFCTITSRAHRISEHSIPHSTPHPLSPGKQAGEEIVTYQQDHTSSSTADDERADGGECGNSPSWPWR